MSDKPDERPALSLRSAEIAVALVLAALGAIVIADSLRLGMRWADEGPQPGYFPFYLGVFICSACAITVVLAALMPAQKNRAFVKWGQLKLVLSVLVPSAVFVALVGWIGIYASAVLFVALFMRWLGKYPWWTVAAVSIGHSIALFMIFEVWFLVPLPKGAVERLLGVG
ncbi:MAG TPA: tripartite tricarboxylate transporter TctB family protein [Burkholderiales bacterium]|nr:tripartite tricarboxylate transporter TctB family protein [Burkholderiales bacterium]